MLCHPRKGFYVSERFGLWEISERFIPVQLKQCSGSCVILKIEADADYMHYKQRDRRIGHPCFAHKQVEGTIFGFSAWKTTEKKLAVDYFSAFSNTKNHIFRA